jgi:hypothetical protein
MARYKGAMLIMLRKLFKQRGYAHELVFVRMLSDDGAKVYNTAELVKWVPVELAAEILLTAAQVLFPRDPAALRKLGREEARDSLLGFKQKHPGAGTEIMVLRQVARIWRNYHDEGRALANEEPGTGRAYLVVEGYPSLPEANREITAGLILEALEMSGFKDVRVRRLESDPQAWKWLIVKE